MAASLPFRVSLDLALEGGAGLSTASFAAAREGCAKELVALASAGAALELIANVARIDDLAEAGEVAAALSKDASDIFILGIGGSSLGGQALAELADGGARPRVSFIDNLDPLSFEAALAGSDLKTTRFVAISKSGATAETLMQTLCAAEALKKVGGEKDLKRNFVVVTEPKASPLRQFAESISCPVLDHPTGIGGRYSVLSVVGLLPAMLMGLDAKALRAGARSVLAASLAAPSSSVSPASGAALHAVLAKEWALRETVLWCYADRLKTFGAWWRQLWAESLGKKGQGTTPVAALGPVDQHSQLQLFLDGPGAALFTLVTTDMAGAGPAVPAEQAAKLGLSYLTDKHMGDLVAAEARATAETLAGRRRPVRQIHVPKLDEHSLGALFMHFMLETILMGRLMGVDPFDQPAVEEGKVLARTYLEGKKA